MEQRVVTKLIVVVQVFIAEREGEHALADQGLDRVLEQSWVAPVGETAGHPTDQPEAAIQPPQQQPSGIRCDDSAIEPGHNLVPFNRFKFEQCWATLCLHRGLSGIAVSDWRIAIFRDSPPRCIKGFEKSGLDGTNTKLRRIHDFDSRVQLAKCRLGRVRANRGNEERRTFPLRHKRLFVGDIEHMRMQRLWPSATLCIGLQPAVAWSLHG